MRKNFAYLLAALVAIVGVIALVNYAFLQRHLAAVLDADPRNSGIEASAHYQFYVVPSVLVFDLRSVSGTNSQMDVSRVLIQFAESQKDKTFETVKLAYRGNAKFLLKGDYFRTIGREYGVQNPVYTLRTFPENVYRLDGSPAFGTWTGGWLGVLSKQMDDLNEFHQQWYIRDMN